MKQFKKVVLAYSGGLDTSIIIPWLKENYGCEVIAVAGNVGQGKELDGLEEKALKTGASKLYIENLTKEYVEEIIFPTLQAGAVYAVSYTHLGQDCCLAPKGFHTHYLHASLMLYRMSNPQNFTHKAIHQSLYP